MLVRVVCRLKPPRLRDYSRQARQQVITLDILLRLEEDRRSILQQTLSIVVATLPRV